MKYLKTYENFSDNSMILYHGSLKVFDKFDIRHFNSGSGDGGWLGRGFYFTNDYSYAESYGEVKRYKINIENPYILTDWYYSIRPLRLMNELGVHNSFEITTKLKSMGYDSVLLKYKDDDIDLDEDLDYGDGIFIELCVFDADKIEKVDESVNELFDSEVDVNINKIERTPASYYAHYIYTTIKGYNYKFTMQLKNGYIYYSFNIVDWRKHKDGKENKNKYLHGNKIDTFNEWDFVVNDSMITEVLNSIPGVTEAFVNEAIKDGLGEEIIKGIYYDADELRRERIYKYFFSKKLTNSSHRKEYGWEFFELNSPVPLKDFKL